MFRTFHRLPKCLSNAKRMNWTKNTSAICRPTNPSFYLPSNQPTPGLKHLFCRDTRVKPNPPTLAKRFKWRRYSSKSLTHVDKSMSVFGIWVIPKIGVSPNHPFLIGFSIINHPFWGTTIFGNIHSLQPFNLPLSNSLIL